MFDVPASKNINSKFVYCLLILFATFVEHKNINLKKFNWIILFFVLAGLFSSCLKNEVCTPAVIELKAGIYTFSESTGIIDTIATAIDIDTLYGITVKDDYLLGNTPQTEEISFPLNDMGLESSFVLGIGEEKDTLRFFYEKHLQFSSIKCGVFYTYTLTDFDYTTHILKDIILNNPEIDAFSTENIQLVF